MLSESKCTKTYQTPIFAILPLNQTVQPLIVFLLFYVRAPMHRLSVEKSSTVKSSWFPMWMWLFPAARAVPLLTQLVDFNLRPKQRPPKSWRFPRLFMEISQSKSIARTVCFWGSIWLLETIRPWPWKSERANWASAAPMTRYWLHWIS